MSSADLLATAELTVLGRITPASNHTYLCRLGPASDSVSDSASDSVSDSGQGPTCVYKPVSGERPLWDFEDGTLADREYAAWVVSEALGWSVVPPTLLRDGPAGPGMVQLWCEPEPDQDPVDLLPEGPVPDGSLHVLDALDGYERPVMLVHEDSEPLRRMALFDIVVNNTDRKGGHVLPMADGHRYGVDHGVCFHVDDKLRTVLWGFHGRRLHAEERAALENLASCLDGPTGEALAPLLLPEEIRATARRANRLLSAGHFPEPGPGWPSLPWPPF